MGNNNAYCHDDEISWFDWELPEGNQDLINFCRELIYFRKQHRVFRRRKWFQGQAIHGEEVNDISWHNPDGSLMTQEQWDVGYAKSMAVFLNGDRIPSPGPQGERVSDDSFLMFFNAHYETIEFNLPEAFQSDRWAMEIDTKEPRFVTEERIFTGEQAVPVVARSLVLLKRLVI
ncbi:MAG: hypothetical protein ICV62_15040 [Cyanobacteria bacterium Co-bin13]|nr:hypothetical protein [Cyanobacteria bacterium Co-bin13]